MHHPGPFCAIAIRQRPLARRAFTLVELIVVLGIITILLSLLMPVLGRVRETSQQTSCLSNLRQVGLGMQAYAMDGDGQMPAQASEAVFDFANPAVVASQPSFLGLLLPSLNNRRSVLVCPMAWEIPWVPSWGPYGNSSTNYMGNAAVVGVRLAALHHAAETIVLQEDKMLWQVCWLRPAPFGGSAAGPVYSEWHWNGDGYGEEYTANHFRQSGGNLLFADCHSEFRAHDMLKARDFGLTSGAGLSGQPADPSSCDNYLTYLGSP